MALDFGDDDNITPTLTPEDQMAMAMLGQMPPANLPPASPVPQPIMMPMRQPDAALSNGPDPAARNSARYGQDMPPDDRTQASAAPAPPPGTIARPPAAMATPPMNDLQRPAVAAPPNPYAPPQVDLSQRDKLVQAAAAARQPQAPVNGGWRNKLGAIISAAAAGYGRDPGAIGRGMAAGEDVLGRPQAEADKAQAGKVAAANVNLQDFDTRSGIESKNFDEKLKGQNAETSRLSEENRSRAEDRAAAAMGTEIDKGFNGGKPTKMTGPDGKDHYFVRTKDGTHIEVDAPDEKPYKSAYERSQSKNPDESKQGRKDYDAEERRKEQRTENDTTRANAAKERADKANKGKGGSTALKHYNDKVDKARKSLQDTTSVFSGIKNYDQKPQLRNQVKQAYDDFNDSVKSYHDEYKTESEDAKEIPEPARISYPWEKGGSNKPPTPSSSAPASKPNVAPASTPSDSGKKAVDSYKSKGGTTYKKGDTIKTGKYAGKTIKAVYADGQMDLQ